MPSLKTYLAFPAALGLLAVFTSAQAQDSSQGNFWQTHCAGKARSTEALTCEATQSVRMKKSGQLLFKVDIVYPAGKAAPLLKMQAPLGFYLPGKIKLAVDDKPVTEMDIGTCDQRGCFLSASAPPEMIDAMKAGAKLQIDFAPAADRRQSISLPLTGFSRAMDAIQ